MFFDDQRLQILVLSGITLVKGSTQNGDGSPTGLDCRQMSSAIDTRGQTTHDNHVVLHKRAREIARPLKSFR